MGIRFLGFEFGRPAEPEAPAQMQNDPRPEALPSVIRKTGRGTGAQEVSPEATQMAKQMVDDIFQKNRAERPGHLWPEIAETKASLDRALKSQAEMSSTEPESEDIFKPPVAEKSIALSDAERVDRNDLAPVEKPTEVVPTALEHMAGTDEKPAADQAPAPSRDQFSHLSPELADKMRTYEAQRVKEPPKLEQKDFLNSRGELVDFSQARTFPELITMLQHEGTIRNGANPPENVPAEVIINQIYKLIYQDLNNFDKSDWTSITLRHNLRATVWDMIQKYQGSAEFQELRGLDVSGAQSVPEIIQLVSKWGRPVIATDGQTFRPEDVYACILAGRLDLLPGPIRHKIIEINQRRAEPEQPEPKSGLLGRTLGKLKFWGK